MERSVRSDVRSCSGFWPVGIVSANTLAAVSGRRRFTVSRLTRARLQSWLKLQSFIWYSPSSPAASSSSPSRTTGRNCCGGCQRSSDCCFCVRQNAASVARSSYRSSSRRRKSSRLAWVNVVMRPFSDDANETLRGSFDPAWIKPAKVPPSFRRAQCFSSDNVRDRGEIATVWRRRTFSVLGFLVR